MRKLLFKSKLNCTWGTILLEKVDVGRRVHYHCHPFNIRAPTRLVLSGRLTVEH